MSPALPAPESGAPSCGSSEICDACMYLSVGTDTAIDADIDIPTCMLASYACVCI